MAHSGAQALIAFSVYPERFSVRLKGARRARHARRAGPVRIPLELVFLSSVSLFFVDMFANMFVLVFGVLKPSRPNPLPAEPRIDPTAKKTSRTFEHTGLFIHVSQANDGAFGRPCSHVFSVYSLRS